MGVELRILITFNAAGAVAAEFPKNVPVATQLGILDIAKHMLLTQKAKEQSALDIARSLPKGNNDAN